MFHHFILIWFFTHSRSGFQQHCGLISCYTVTKRKQDLIGDTMVTAARITHIVQSPLQYPLGLLHMQIVMQLPALPMLPRHTVASTTTMPVADAILGKKNVYADLYSPSRHLTWVPPLLPPLSFTYIKNTVTVSLSYRLQVNQPD